jgi:hypothetical protein
MERKIEPNKARQGRSGWPVLMILICALVLVAIGWVGVELFGEAIEPANTVGGDPSQAPAPATPTN